MNVFKRYEKYDKETALCLFAMDATLVICVSALVVYAFIAGNLEIF